MKEHAWDATPSLWTLLPPSWVTKFNFQLISAPEPLTCHSLPLPLQWQACPMFQGPQSSPPATSALQDLALSFHSFWVQCWDGDKAQSNSDLGTPEEHRPLRTKTENPELCKQWSNLGLAPRLGCGHLHSSSLFSRLMQFHALNSWGKAGRNFPTFWDHSFLPSQLQNYSLLLSYFPTV